jgi:hypothetical protein
LSPKAAWQEGMRDDHCGRQDWLNPSGQSCRTEKQATESSSYDLQLGKHTIKITTFSALFSF